MKISLRYGLPLLVIGLGMVQAVALVVYNAAREKAEIEREAQRDLYVRGSRLQGTVEYLLRHGDEQRAQDEITGLGAEQDFRLVLLIDENWRIMASLRVAHKGRDAHEVIGSALESEAIDWMLRARTVRSTMESAAWLNHDEGRVVGIYPVTVGSTAEALRPDRVGVLVLWRDLTALRNRVRRDLSRQAVLALSILVVITLVLWLVLDLAVTRRVKRLVDATQRFAHGDYRTSSGVTGRDEIGTLGRAFDAMAQDLDRHNVHLEDLVRDRTVELESANRKLLEEITQRHAVEKDLISAKKSAEAANEAKTTFLANTSHEIRTPMNAIMGMAHLVLQTELSIRQRDQITKILNAARNLLSIIDEILDFSKIEAGRIELEAIDFNVDDLLKRVSDMVLIRADNQGLELLLARAPDVPKYLVGDPVRIAQVLINLANNAVKFTESGEVVVRVDQVAKDPDQVTLRFSVRDTGAGLDEEQISRLFQPFSQADASTTRRFGGTGLGLAISKRLVEVMGGRIDVESEPGRGSCFSFDVEFEPQADPKPVKRRELLSASGNRIKVLVVDDSESAREIFLGYCAAFSLEAKAVSSGDEALAELQHECGEGKEPYWLVLMDWRMPGLNGIETAIRVGEDREIEPKPRIILVSEFEEEGMTRSAMEVGIDGVLFKPVTPSTLWDAVLELLGEEVSGRHLSVAEEPQATTDIVAIRGAHVLLVEDNEINQEIGAELLRSQGVDVTIAGDGVEAVRVLRACKSEIFFDAVLMDLHMPELDGIEATLQIRGEIGFQYLPIIAMTADAIDGVRQRCLEAGMNDYISKPVEPDEVFETLARWVGRR